MLVVLVLNNSYMETINNILDIQRNSWNVNLIILALEQGLTLSDLTLQESPPNSWEGFAFYTLSQPKPLQAVD
jgi:hypothetical protein